MNILQFWCNVILHQSHQRPQLTNCEPQMWLEVFYPLPQENSNLWPAPENHDSIFVEKDAHI